MASTPVSAGGFGVARANPLGTAAALPRAGDDSKLRQYCGQPGLPSVGHGNNPSDREWRAMGDAAGAATGREETVFLWLGAPLAVCLLLRDQLGERSSVWPILALLALTAVVRRGCRLGPLATAWRGTRAGYWLLGGVLSAGFFWPERPAPIMTALWLSLCVPVVEEFYFRGLVWDVAARDGRDGLAVLISTALFVVAHLGAMPPGEAALMGAVLGGARWWGGSVWCAVALHAGWNGGVVVGPAMALVALAVGLVDWRGERHGQRERSDELAGVCGR